jgi:GNAT superfamily N-acetyltransferase
MLKDLVIREATLEDLSTVIHHRRSMYVDMGHRDPAKLAAMEAAARPFFAAGLASGTYHGWLVERPSHEIVAGGGVIIFPYHASPADPSPRRPFIVNMYTEPPFRRQGVAREVMQTMITWCREEGFGSIALHASEDGRPLYASLGFKPTNEMRLMLR